MTTFVRCDVCGREVGAQEPYKQMQISQRWTEGAVPSEAPVAVFHLHDACWDALVAWAGTQRGQAPAAPEPPAGAPETPESVVEAQNG